MAPPTPRLYGSRRTVAPAARATSAVPSREPSSTTTTSAVVVVWISFTTFATVSRSFHAGTMTRTRWSSAMAVLLDVGAQQCDLLGEHPRLLLQPAALPRQVHHDKEEEDHGEEEDQVGAVRDAEPAGGRGQEPGGEGEGEAQAGGEEPERGFLLPERAPPQQLHHQPEKDDREGASHQGALAQARARLVRPSVSRLR